MEDSDSIRRAIHTDARLYAAYNIGREAERAAHGFTPDDVRALLDSADREDRAEVFSQRAVHLRAIAARIRDCLPVIPQSPSLVR